MNTHTNLFCVLSYAGFNISLFRCLHLYAYRLLFTLCNVFFCTNDTFKPWKWLEFISQNCYIFFLSFRCALCTLLICASSLCWIFQWYLRVKYTHSITHNWIVTGRTDLDHVHLLINAMFNLLHLKVLCIHTSSRVTLLAQFH